MKTEKKQALYFWLYSLVIAALFLFVKGYLFNESDQEEHLPQVYKLLDPSLYPSDPFVLASGKVFTVRYFYIQFVYFFSTFLGVKATCFILTYTSILFCTFGLMKLASVLSPYKLTSYLLPVLCFFIFYDYTIGQNHIEYSILISSTLAKAFIPFVFYYFLKEKYLISGLLLGIATLFQLLVGLQVFLILLGILILSKPNLKRNLIFIFSFFVFSSFILAPIIYRQFFLSHSTAFPEDETYFKILYSFRNNLHYLPSLFPIKDYVKLFALLAFCIYVLFRSNLPNRNFILKLLGLIIMGCLTYSILLEGVNFYPIGKIQWFKTTIWLGLFCSLILSHFIGQKIENNGAMKSKLKWFFAIIFLALIAKGTFRIIRTDQTDKKNLSMIHQWIDQNTPKDAVILSFPKDNSLLCEAKRSTPIAFGPIIHETFFMIPWYNRFKEIYGIGLEDISKGTALNLADSVYNSRFFHSPEKYKIDYRIDRKSLCKYLPQLGPVVFQSGDYILTKVD